VRVFFDRSVLVAALVETHAAHERAVPYLNRVRDGADTGYASAHSLAELYAILTAMPLHPRPTHAEAVAMIRSGVLPHFAIVALAEAEYWQLLDHAAAIGLAGGAIYDALHMLAAATCDPDQIVTFNERHFRRVYPALAGRIVVP
jgi:predicted nucleic acid-binding protein